MNAPLAPLRARSICPHDCPSVCALNIEIDGMGRLGRMHGDAEQSYTAGVVCAKVARYAERRQHPERLMRPLRRVGPKGSGQFQEIAWDDALDLAAEKMLAAEREFGAESIWPYFYAGTMGLVMRDGVARLAAVKGYSGFYSTICVNIAWAGWLAGAGRMIGADPREIDKSDCVVIWGTNPATTQINVLTHAIRARKERGAKIVAIDIYRNETLKQADLALCLRPGTDAALACAIMHILFRDGHADRDYLAAHTDDPAALEAHVKTRDPHWASAITGLSVDEIEAFAALLGERKRAFFRLGYGFARRRNGAVSMHAALCVPTVLGAWKLEGGGAFHSFSSIYGLDKSLIEGLDAKRPGVRRLDQSRIGAVLTGEREALKGGAPVKVLLVQSTNPAVVAPDQTKVRRGLAREDLFTIVHEQFMTDTAAMADLVLPATMFMEHDDLYTAGGHSHLGFGAKLFDPPGECRTNHDVVCALAERVGAKHDGFRLTSRDIVDRTLRMSERGDLATLEAAAWVDMAPTFEDAHFLNGFGHRDAKFHFRADWAKAPFAHDGLMGPWRELPELPDYWTGEEAADDAHPFRLATSPARNFLNSSFTETPTSRAREVRPSVLVHPQDAAALGVVEGSELRLGNARGEVRLHAKMFDGVQRGVLIAEGIWPPRDMPEAGASTRWWAMMRSRHSAARRFMM